MIEQVKEWLKDVLANDPSLGSKLSIILLRVYSNDWKAKKYLAELIANQFNIDVDEAGKIVEEIRLTGLR